MPQLRFAKMQGVGNDFVVVNADQLDGLDPARVALQLCERRFGVGSDGLLIIGQPSDSRAAFSFRMHNPDGTPDMCGNGLRCAVLYAHHIGLVPERSDTFFIETIDGLQQGHLVEIHKNGKSATIRVEMTIPRLTPAEIPFTAPMDPDSVIAYPLDTPHGALTITAINTGSTHSVAFVDELPGDDDFLAVSPFVETHPAFPERTSLMWTKQTDENIFAVRIWERAAGETFGCGTGACAIAAAAILTGRARHGETIQVVSKGGTLLIDWPRRDGVMWLTGGAEWVFEGVVGVDSVVEAL